MKATDGRGVLNSIEECYLTIPGLYGLSNEKPYFQGDMIKLDNLPDIGDSKHASYGEENIIGRSSPIHVYSFSNTRQISMQIHLFINQPGDAEKNLDILRAIASCTYPREPLSTDLPYQPPVICILQCGKLLANEGLCVILQQYQVRFPTDVVWDEKTYCPYKFDIDTNWWVVYSSSVDKEVGLPYSSRIIRSGR